MKRLGTDQLLAMKFERLPVSEAWYGILGRISATFMMIVYGESGEGKTTFCVQLAKELLKFAPGTWNGYETGFGADIQDVVDRNDMKGLPMIWNDPWANLTEHPELDFPRSGNNQVDLLFGDLVYHVTKKKSAKYWFIDSEDAAGFTEAQVVWLNAKYGRRKGFIFIAHAKGKDPEKAVSRKIEFYGQIGIYVKGMIAYPVKNRFGGNVPYVIDEAEARRRNPLFFGQGAGAAVVPEVKKRGRPKKKKE